MAVTEAELFKIATDSLNLVTLGKALKVSPQSLRQARVSPFGKKGEKNPAYRRPPRGWEVVVVRHLGAEMTKLLKARSVLWESMPGSRPTTKAGIVESVGESLAELNDQMENYRTNSKSYRDAYNDDAAELVKILHKRGLRVVPRHLTFKRES